MFYDLKYSSFIGSNEAFIICWKNLSNPLSNFLPNFIYSLSLGMGKFFHLLKELMIPPALVSKSLAKNLSYIPLILAFFSNFNIILLNCCDFDDIKYPYRLFNRIFFFSAERASYKLNTEFIFLHLSKASLRFCPYSANIFFKLFFLILYISGFSSANDRAFFKQIFKPP